MSDIIEKIDSNIHIIGIIIFFEIKKTSLIINFTPQVWHNNLIKLNFDIYIFYMNMLILVDVFRCLLQNVTY